MKREWIVGVAIALFTASRAVAMELTSPDVVEGTSLSRAQVHADCGGGNIAPSLAWSGAPAATKSFALTVYDPDATGGWWHWIVLDIGPNVHGLLRGGSPLPPGSRPGNNDYGAATYSGACPPPGSGVHHYRFTLWALDVTKVVVDGASKGAAIEPFLKAHALASATLTATYER